MKYITDWAEKKKINIGGVEKQLIEGAFKDEGGITVEATIWRDGKDGSIFPNFDSIAPGTIIMANPWTNPKNGKVVLYPIKEASTGSIRRSGGMNPAISKLMDKKEESIGKFQESKEVSIKLAGAMRDAVLIVTTMMQTDKVLGEAIDVKVEILKWRNWILDNYGDSRDVNVPF